MLNYELVEKVEAMQRQVHKKYIAEWTAHSPLKITPPQATMLTMIDRLGVIKVSEFIDLLGISASGLTMLSDKLEEKGLIIRTRDENDRRIVYLQLSDQGRELLEPIRKLKLTLFTKLLEGMDEKELEALMRIYVKVSRNLGITCMKQD